MTWQLQDEGIGHAAEWLGKCGDCGANMSVGYLCTSMWRPGKDARETPCSGPGTAWQEEMLRERQQAVVAETVSGFGQALKSSFRPSMACESRN
jgi:hypothetical protein